MATYMRERRGRRREQMRDRLGGVCVRCGASEGLEFDHVDPNEKLMDISSARALDGPLAALEAEVDKCQLLCRPCHVTKSKESGEVGGGQNRIHQRPHGSGPRYADGCRCLLCKLWKRQYREGVVSHSEGSLPAGERGC